ncbi:MAG: hypothetical protein HYY81_06195 [Deltaproteobacteria bacterium]|nr:hypothetical protein [Deltaproteobacteria bacterium]
MKYFDYETVAREAKIPPEKIKRLVQLIREEFPNDPLMCDNQEDAKTVPVLDWLDRLPAKAQV